MKIYISYSSKDANIASLVYQSVKELGSFDIVLPEVQEIQDYSADSPFYSLINLQNKGESGFLTEAKSQKFAEIEREIIDADIAIILYSRNYKSGYFADREMHTILTNAALNVRKRVIVLTLDHTRRSNDLEQHKLVYGSDNLEGGIDYLKSVISDYQGRLGSELTEVKAIEDAANDTEELNQKIVDYLKDSYEKGFLTLVVGSGISMDANMPNWNNLLDDLLEKMVSKHTGAALGGNNVNSEGFKELRESSSLILGQYLKNSLKGDFIRELRESLYRTSDNSTASIDAICEMSMPHRAGNDLDSIITFNFDDLLERNFGKNGIRYREIYQEGVRAGPSEIPIYNVHGFLPKDGELSQDMGVVFSEDAYHDQFIDPFSWSNLIQLSKFAQNTCLFVGLSLSDPNLRRLLDVSNRKETSAENRHYVILKRRDSSVKDTLIESLREQDAAALGLGVLWVNSYDDIPQILRKISVV